MTKNFTMREAAEHVVNVLFAEGNGVESYLAGGAVRDLLRGEEPHDFDVATAMVPEDVAKVFPDNYDFVGAHFGVSLLKFGNVTVEVATFRTEESYSDGRHPDDVKYTTSAEEDAKRRDLTVNALFMLPNGAVVDYVNGQEDLKNKVVRCVGDPDKRFQEDGLRLLRAVRFCATLDFTMAPETFAAVKRNAHLVQNVSVERVAIELEKMLTSGHADVAYDLLLDTGLATYIIPELCAFVGCEHRSPKYHPEGDVANHVRGLLKGLPKDCSVTLALAALLHDVGKPATLAVKEDRNTFYGHEQVGAGMAKDILRRLKFSNDVVDTVVSHVRNHMMFFVAPQMKKSKVFHFAKTREFDELLALHRLDAGSSSKDCSTAEFMETFLKENAEKLRSPRLVNGDDLVAMGYTPGPGFKVLLETVENAQFEGTATTREEALAFAKKRAKSVLGKTKVKVPTYPIIRVGDWVKVKFDSEVQPNQVGRVIRECQYPPYEFVVQFNHMYAMKRDQLEILSDEEAMIYILER